MESSLHTSLWLGPLSTSASKHQEVRRTIQKISKPASCSVRTGASSSQFCHIPCMKLGEERVNSPSGLQPGVFLGR